MAKDDKYKDLAKDIEELLKKMAEGELLEEKKTKPLLSHTFNFNEEEYKKFKTILYSLHFLYDIDNDEIEYEFQDNEKDVAIIWKSPGIYLSRENRDADLFSKLIMLSDACEMTVSGLDELCLRLLIKNLVKGNEK